MLVHLQSCILLEGPSLILSLVVYVAELILSIRHNVVDIVGPNLMVI